MTEKKSDGESMERNATNRPVTLSICTLYVVCSDYIRMCLDFRVSTEMKSQH